MATWFSSLEWFDKIFWVIAIIASLLFIIMLLVTFIGGSIEVDADMDGDIDMDSGGFHFFTIKNLIAFFTIFGWVGIACIDADLSKAATITISFISGISMMFIMAGLFFAMTKLNDSGTLKIKNAVGAIGEVYMTVGAERRTIGKVNVRIQGALRELEALTDENEDLKQGAVVKVKEVTSNGILIVNLLKK